MMMMETETEVMWLDPREHLLLATNGTEKDARKETYRSRVALPQFQTSGIWNYERNTSIVSSPLPYDQLLWQTQKSNKLPLRRKSKRFLRGGRDIPTLSLDRGEGGPACPFMRWHFGRDTGLGHRAGAWGHIPSSWTPDRLAAATWCLNFYVLQNGAP